MKVDVVGEMKRKLVRKARMIEIELVTQNFVSAVRFAQASKARRAPLTSLLIHSKLLAQATTNKETHTCRPLQNHHLHRHS